MMQRGFNARLQRTHEKGGWTYVQTPFPSAEYFGRKGNIPVEATIDGQPLTGTLMPLGDGSHMLAVKAEVRRAIGKQAGDLVRVELTVQP